MLVMDQTVPRFNYETQNYTADAECSIAFESFPCPKCQAPARMVWYDDYREYYACSDERCKHRFTVR